MGQYWKPVNLDKREFIDPHKLGCGLKLWEQIANKGIGQALVVLLAVMPEKRGGGDLQNNPFIGRWAGDRVVFVGDYSVDDDMTRSPIPFGSVYDKTLYDDNGEPEFTDITADVIEILQTEGVWGEE